MVFSCLYSGVRCFISMVIDRCVFLLIFFRSSVIISVCISMSAWMCCAESFFIE